jgi:hypothetical protein
MQKRDRHKQHNFRKKKDRRDSAYYHTEIIPKSTYHRDPLGVSSTSFRKLYNRFFFRMCQQFGHFAGASRM